MSGRKMPTPQSKRYLIDPERLAYWYLRLNGFLTIENFILHDECGGPQRTDIDVIGMRFPHRREALRDYNDKLEWMEDDPCFAAKATRYVALVEVTIGRCKLNGPWTDPAKANIPRALKAIGAFRDDAEIKRAATDIYRTGHYKSDSIEFQLVSLGRELNEELYEIARDGLQLVWDDVLKFIFQRFQSYQAIKREHPQWDRDGHCLWNAFQESRDWSSFAEQLDIRPTLVQG
jgi:hypothetical protein